MGVAAYALPVVRRSEWLEELERILDLWDGLSMAARDAVVAVLESFLGDDETTDLESIRARVLLARIKPENSGSGALARRLDVAREPLCV
jgi:hypothetical protein